MFRQYCGFFKHRFDLNEMNSVLAKHKCPNIVQWCRIEKHTVLEFFQVVEQIHQVVFEVHKQNELPCLDKQSW